MSNVCRVVALWAWLIASHIDAQEREFVGSARATTSTQGATTQTAGAERPTVLALAVAGGISLGAYQAGNAWATLQVLRGREQINGFVERVGSSSGGAGTKPQEKQVVLRAVGGASAGGINALLMALEYCADSVRRNPRESLFWRTWIPIGTDNLLLRWKDEPEPSILSRSAFQGVWFDVWERMRAPAVPDCEVAVGTSLTSYASEDIVVVPGVEAPNQRYVGVVRVVGAAKRLAIVAPRRSDMLGSEFAHALVPAPLLDSLKRPIAAADPDSSAVLDSSAVAALFEATSAFPVAFLPRSVRAERVSRLEGTVIHRTPCVVNAISGSCAPARQASFVDGGVFDNRPLGLTLALARSIDSTRLDTERPAALRVVTSLREAAFKECREGADARGDSTLSEVEVTLARLTAEVTRTAARLRDSTSALSGDSLYAMRTLLEVKEDSLTRTSSAFGAQARLQSRLRAKDAAECNSALEALEGAERRLAALSAGERVHVHFIDDDATRGNSSLRRARPTTPRPGMVATARWFASAIASGQNAELVRFGTARRAGSLSERYSRLSVNTRHHRLMAEHLGHFGAFLAEPFREHDFLVGVYDGLRSAFREWHCTRPGIVDSVTTGCEIALLRTVIAGEWLALIPDDRRVLERLLRIEENAEQELAPPAEGHNRLTSLVDANVYARSMRGRECREQAILVESALCEDGYLDVVEYWRKELGRLGSASPCQRQDGEPTYCAVVRDPRASFHRVMYRVLVRGRAVESQVEREFGSGVTLPLDLALLAERSFNEQYRGLFQDRDMWAADFNPSTADAIQRWWGSTSKALPINVSGSIVGGAKWIDWRPTLYLARISEVSMAVGMPLSIARSQGAYEGSVGAAMIFYPPFPWVSSLSAGYQFGDGVNGGADVSMSTLAGIVRVGLRMPTNNGPMSVGARQVYIGIGDANGVVSRAIAMTIGGLSP